MAATIASELLTDHQSEFTAALIGAVATLLASYLAFRLQSAREPRKRLVWNAKTQGAGIDIDSDIRQRIQLLYRGSPVDELTLIEFHVENAGNQVIRDHQIRFEFPPTAALVDAHCSPEPDRELGVERRTSLEQSRSEVIYGLGQLESGQGVTFKILASGQGGERWRPISYSPEGGVQFVEGSVIRTANDSEHVVPFCFSAFLLMALAGLGASGLVRNLSVMPKIAIGVIALIVVGFALRHLAPAVRFVRDVMLKWYETRSANEITVQGSVSALSVGDHSSATQMGESGSRGG
ncbi:hypothetical protein ACQEU8_11635 [Streptomyces sp. CA-250714]|uniref:hypothetical protein n=1 Tax=Streptomyces sp. CA-250714 TaxID=3240060 RepID=UPI003D91EB8A